MDVPEGQVAYELGFDDSADVGEVRTKVVHGVDGRARLDGSVDLAEVGCGFSEEFLGFAVVRIGLAFLGKRLGVWDEL